MMKRKLPHFVFLCGLIFFSGFAAAQPFSSSDVPPLERTRWSFGWSAKNQLPEQFTVLVWNLHKEVEAEPFQRDFLELAHKSHLLMTQEALIEDRTWPLYQSFSELIWTLGVSFYVKDESPTGVMTGARFQSSNWGVVRSHSHEPMIRTPKMIVWNLFRSPAGYEPVLTINIHALNFVRDEINQQHIQQALDLAEAYKGPVILAGDFNTWNKKRQRFLQLGARRLNLLSPNWEGDPPNPRFDYVFYRGLEARKAIVRRDIKSSDHDPLVVEFAFPRP